MSGHSKRSDRKASGATYTPSTLSVFMAERLLPFPARPTIRVLEPAIGEGDLLLPLVEMLLERTNSDIHITAFDIDAEALATAERRIMELGGKRVSTDFRNSDFLLYEGPGFDLIISNPPYVRTQTIGKERTKEIAERFGLSGRIDLSFAFVVRMFELLDKEGRGCLITSNKFMSSASGKSLRSALDPERIVSIHDFGDTALFDAAVLPAVMTFAGKKSNEASVIATIYTTDRTADFAGDPFEIIARAEKETVFAYQGKSFIAKTGILDTDGPAWTIKSASRTRAGTRTFKDIGKIRVGVKSTADKVFVKNDEFWRTLPAGRPECLFPLITGDSIRPWGRPETSKSILYPHASENGVKRVLPLEEIPKAASYLNEHRDRLSSRKYLIDAGRKWHEIWVSQDPSAWSAPKLVWRDISDRPCFSFDDSGAVVNGECFWLSSEDTDTLLLAMMVGNSRFIMDFYDDTFNNKLYSGRRRFVAQYVSEFPLPEKGTWQADRLIAIARKHLDDSTTPSQAELLEVEEILSSVS